MMRKSLAVIVLILVLLAAVPALAQSQVDVYQGGKLVTSVVFVVGRAEYFVNGETPGRKMDAAPYIENGRTFVPVRFLGYGLGVSEDNVKWYASERKASLTLPPNTVEMVIGKKRIVTNGSVKDIDVAPQLKLPGRTFLPARFVAEGLGYRVDYENAGGKEYVICWPENEPRPESDIGRVKEYVDENPVAADPESRYRELYDSAKPFAGQPLDHSRFTRESRLVQRAKEISFITVADLPARVGSHAILEIDLSQAETDWNRIKTTQVALGNVTGGGYVTPADLIFWTKADNELIAETPGLAPHKEHVFAVYYPFYGLKPVEVKYFVFASGGQLLAVKNPLYKGD